jgi:uncharacterized BrkB/YihY/UPF0761 family membrane protein
MFEKGKQDSGRSMWTLSGMSFVTFGKRMWNEINGVDVFGRAAQLAYYFLLALSHC